VSDRRRSLFVLLIVAALIGGSLAVIFPQPTKLGLDLQGGSQLVYQAESTAQQQVDPDAMQRSIDLMQERVNAFGVSEAEINQAGDDQIEVNLPGVEDAEEAAAQVGSTAQLFFYDWEANILDEDCQTNPDENSSAKTATTG
jgi:SecD/SecF fusion protein